MKTLLSINKLKYQIPDRTLFENLNLTINAGDRVGLVGTNGTGKSTLLNLISGNEEMEEGQLIYSKNLQIEVVEQFIPKELLDKTLYQSVLEKLELDEYGSNEYLVAKALEDLGFVDEEFSYLVKDLSGGQHNRLMLARAVINEPDLVLFDEPTNHLDLSTILLVERFLKRNKNLSYLVISHDRQFLDNVTNKTIVLRDQGTYEFKASYSEAMKKLAEQDEAAMKKRECEEKEIKRLEKSAKRLAIWGRENDNEDLSRKAKTMYKRIEKLKDEQTFVTEGGDYTLHLTTEASRNPTFMHTENATIGYHQPLFKIKRLYIRKGDRVVLLGPNGVGKTTFIKKLMESYQNEDAKAHEGVIKFNPQVKIGYYDQEQLQLQPEDSIFGNFRSLLDNTNDEIKHTLVKAGFKFRDHEKRVAVLSGGEKARLLFLILKLKKPNFLILDEPTNHIDIEGKEQLEDQLKAGQNTLLFVSHDREFVQSVANRYLFIEDGELWEGDESLLSLGA